MLMKQRHQRAMTYLTAEDGDWLLLDLGCGDLQGDRSAPDRFTCLYDPRLMEWVDATTDLDERSVFQVVEEVTGAAVNLSYTTFADDNTRIVLLGKDKPDEEAMRKIQEWDDGLVTHVQETTQLAQNVDKKEIMLRCRGAGAPRAMQNFYHKKNGIEYRGEAKTWVKHLGGWHNCDGWTYHENDMRIRAARNGWNAMSRVWTSNTPRRIRKLLYTSLVRGRSIVWLRSQRVDAEGPGRLRQV